MHTINWLKNFKCETVIYGIRIDGDEALVVELVQAKRVNRLRRQLLYKSELPRVIVV
jgi:hypothetical protein